ncbi:MAG TPA: hypothetical protein PLP05_08930 [Sedimentisphaerales bacterium]|nr:hypothetical protein [Sedimentisphaerales bacterium]
MGSAVEQSLSLKQVKGEGGVGFMENIEGFADNSKRSCFLLYFI